MKMKKIAAMTLAAVMTMGMASTAFAATITITNQAKGEIYTAYKLFDVTYSDDQLSFSYTIPATSTALKSLLEQAGFAFTASADGSVFYVNNADSLDAAAAAAVLNENKGTLASLITGIDVTDSKTATVDAGYYFVDTSLGSFCALETATDSITITEKNSIPSVTKKVKNGSDAADQYADWADIDVVDTIDYKVTVNTGTNEAQTGTGNDADITLKDQVPAGVTLKETDGAYITIDGWVKDTDYTESYDAVANELTIVLKSSKVATLGQNVNIDITYSATVTDTDVFQKDGGLNTNTVTMNYKAQEGSDTADVASYQITGETSFTKIDGTSSDALEGVGFTLMKEGDGYVNVDEYGVLTSYSEGYTLDADNAANSVAVIYTDAEGKINVKGLDAGTYVLTEVYALPGYNMLAGSKTIVINGNTVSDNGVVAEKTFTVTMGDVDGEQAAIGGQNIANFTGSQLPSTGGIGTTIFYVVGGILVVGAGVVLVAKKRMNHEA